MTFTDRLYCENKELWEKYLSHPFVQGMINEDVDIEKFRYYMLQDYVYLKEYLKVFAIGLSKTDIPSLREDLTKSINAIYWEIDNVHMKYMKKIGITDENIQNVKPDINNISYTSYMISSAYLGDESYALAAVLSCSWSYQFIGKYILKTNPDILKNSYFAEWVEAYSSEEYDEANQRLIDIMNEVSKTKSDEELDKLSDIFKNCSIYEYGFWDMAYNMGGYYAGV